jgi:beta-fructofuranosidase
MKTWNKNDLVNPVFPPIPQDNKPIAGDNSSYYLKNSFKHPQVFKQRNSDTWAMIFSAKASGITEPYNGCIGLATSEDLNFWTLEPPIYVGGYESLDHPQIFSSNGNWFILYSVEDDSWSPRIETIYSRSFLGGQHYLTLDPIKNKWHIPNQGFLSPFLSSGKVIKGNQGPLIIGNYEGDDADKHGTITHPYKLKNMNGKLAIRKK